MQIDKQIEQTTYILANHFPTWVCLPIYLKVDLF
jgi:hypothetical protein